MEEEEEESVEEEKEEVEENVEEEGNVEEENVEEDEGGPDLPVAERGANPGHGEELLLVLVQQVRGRVHVKQNHLEAGGGAEVRRRCGGGAEEVQGSKEAWRTWGLPSTSHRPVTILYPFALWLSTACRGGGEG